MKHYFIYTVGNVHKQAEISQPFGNADVYYISIDKYHHGQMFKRNGEWVAALNDKSELTIEDIRIIGEEIDQIK